MSRSTLAHHIARLEPSPPRSTLDPESAYTNLDPLNLPSRQGEEGREHYVDVGPSRLRSDLHGIEGLGTGGGTLSGAKYAGRATGRQKIFDDDEDGSEVEEDGVNDLDGDEDDEGSNGGGGTVHEEGPEAEEGSEDSDEDEDDDEDEEEDQDEAESIVAVDEGEAAPLQLSTASGRTLEPVTVLREARLRDIEKGRGIRRQKALFESLISLRIIFQKAFIASQSLPEPLQDDPSSQMAKQRNEILDSLSTLSEDLMEMRRALVLPSTDLSQVGKRKRDNDIDDDDDAGWIADAARDSFALVDAQHEQTVSILDKWSSKIQAATVSTSKTAGTSNFLQSTRSQATILEAIDAGLASRRGSSTTLIGSEEAGYRALLREVIESRGSGSGIDLTGLRREKKKKREADRGGSKGRKLRYTVHEKAQNFTVPIPHRHAWHDEQVDELFSSLLGGVGMRGATSENAVMAGGTMNGDDGLGILGG